MIIDYPCKQSIPALKSLWKQAFGDTDTFIEGFFATGFDPAHCRCIYEADRLVTALYWFDCLWQKDSVAYLYAIATDAGFQNRGFCRVLMSDTHRLLQHLGYAGAILVPAEEHLFGMYAKLGYRPFCPMKTQRILPSDTPAPIQVLDADTYARLRGTYLPENGVVQDGAALDYLATYATFCAGEGTLFCYTRDADRIRFQEFMGDKCALPGILQTLNATEGILRSPGGNTPLAMYYSFTDPTALPGYFGIALD